MGNRIIKETIRTSKSINALNDFQFRLWVYLLTYVDDYGRGSADTELLKGFVFPRRKEVREQDIDKGLDALERNGSIRRYRVAGESYFCFPNWGNHQRIQTKQSKFPAPEDADAPGWQPPASEFDDFPPEVGEVPEEQPPAEPPKREPETKEDQFSEFAATDEALLKTLRDFEKMRAKIKKPLSDRAKSLLLSRLKTFPKEEWIPILEQSIYFCWQGIFPLKDDAHRQQERKSGKAQELDDFYGMGANWASQEGK